MEVVKCGASSLCQFATLTIDETQGNRRPDFQCPQVAVMSGVVVSSLWCAEFSAGVSSKRFFLA